MAQPPTNPGPQTDDMEHAVARPFYLILFAVIVFVYVISLSANPALRQPGHLIVFTLLMLAHGGLHWLSQYLPERRRLTFPYFVVQGLLILAISLLAGLQENVFGLYVALIGEAAGILWPDLCTIALIVFLCLALLALGYALPSQLASLVEHLPLIGFSSLFALVYALLFVRQTEARQRAQELLAELEGAHRQLKAYAEQVEKLTVTQERERMARELHDTLAQGVAGLIMQLEAADSHLERDNPARAQAVVQQAMLRARSTLDEARRAIQALRPAALEEGSLLDALERETDTFTVTTGVKSTLEAGAGTRDLTPDQAQAILRVVQESLSNAARHANASQVLVRLKEHDGRLCVIVQDDGDGFDPAQVQPGHYGLAGMQERAARIGAELLIESSPGSGTRVTLTVPGSET